MKEPMNKAKRGLYRKKISYRGFTIKNWQRKFGFHKIGLTDAKFLVIPSIETCAFTDRFPHGVEVKVTIEQKSPERKP